MTLSSVVYSIMEKHKVPEKVIIKTVEVLLNACNSKHTISAIAKLVKEADEYEKAPVA